MGRNYNKYMIVKYKQQVIIEVERQEIYICIFEVRRGLGLNNHV